MIEIYTAYSSEADITFIMQDTYEEDKIVSTEVVGFYFGEPREELTQEYRGKLKATF